MARNLFFDNLNYTLEEAKIAATITTLHSAFSILGPDPSQGLEYFSNDDGTCSVGMGECQDSAIVIPRVSPDGDAVTAIAEDGFCGIEASSIAIPDTITSIGENAFKDSQINIFVLPENISFVGPYAFYNLGCSTPTKIPKKLTEITPYSFANFFAVEDENVEIVEIPEGVKKIGEGAFYNARANHWKLPLSLNEIGEKAFYTSDLSAKIYIHIEDLEKWFHVYFPSRDGYTYPSFNGIYVNGKLLEGNLTIPEDIIMVHDGTFQGNQYITSITLLNKRTTLEQYAFNNCPNLKTIYFPGTVEEFENEAEIWFYSTLEQIICTDGVIE